MRLLRTVAVLSLSVLTPWPARADFVVTGSSGSAYRSGAVYNDRRVDRVGVTYAEGGDGSSSVYRQPGSVHAASSDYLTTVATTTTLRIAASTSATGENDFGFVNAQASAGATIDFTVDASGAYSVVGSLDTAATSYHVSSFQYIGSTRLTDLTTSADLFAATATSPSAGPNQGQDGSIPSLVTLIAGHSYRLAASASSFVSDIHNINDPIGDGFVRGSSSATITLRPAPEPASWILAGTGGLASAAFIAIRRRRRR